MKRCVPILATGLLAPVLLAGGCHHQATATAAAPAPGIAVSQARLVLPAVKGNPGAAYFTLGNTGHAAATLVGVWVVGAQRAEMHETSGGAMRPLAQAAIDPGGRIVFAPGGRHVMVFGLTPALTPGGSSEIIFHFQGGKAVTAPLRIESAGGNSAGAMAGMPGMSMGGKP